MPIAASEIESFDWLRLLVIGPPKVGKTTACVGTAPRPVYVLLSDDKAALKPATQKHTEFTYDLVNASDGAKLVAQWEAAFREAKRGAEAGEYKTIVWDTITSFARLLIEAELLASNKGNGPNGREAYPAYGRRLRSMVGRLINIPAHVIVTAQDFPVSAEMEGQVKKRGPGILPNVEGSVRGELGSFFQDVVYLERDVVGGVESRSFVCSMAGVFGAGSRNLPGVEKIPADVTAMWKMMGDAAKAPAAAPTTARAAVRVPPPKVIPPRGNIVKR
jgi:hypothetical protein